jgi:4-oxalocrotonate tautomerase
MPHVIIKMYVGKSDEQKAELASAVTKAVMASTGHGEEAVSVSVEDVEPADWTEKVYRPDINSKPELLYKKPDYNPLSVASEAEIIERK